MRNNVYMSTYERIPHEEYVPYFEDGVKDKDIADALGVSERTVWARRKEWEQNIRTRGVQSLDGIGPIEVDFEKVESLLLDLPKVDKDAQIRLMLDKQTVLDALKTKNSMAAELIKHEILDKMVRERVLDHIHEMKKAQLDFYKDILVSCGK